MARQIVVGIDIGTSEVRVVVAEGIFEHKHIVPKIIGTGSAESRGVYRGYVGSVPEAARSIRAAVARAEKAAGVKVRRAYVSFGGIGLGSLVSTGTAAVMRPDMEITERDLSQALESAEAAIPPTASINKRIINTVPIEYKIDGKIVWGEAKGLKAAKIEVKALFITCLEHHLTDLINAVEEAGVEVVDVVAAPVALSFVTISKKEKRVGCLLSDIGAETLSVVVFENNNLISLEVFPVGGNDLTNDIALGLKLSLEDAEAIKRDPSRNVMHSKRKLDEIVSDRMGSCFELVGAHLKSIGRDTLLPAGVILAGGGASAANVKAVAEKSLKLPARVADVHFGSGSDTKIKERTWALAFGLAIVGFNADDEQSSIGLRNGSALAEGSRQWSRAISRWVSQFLP